MGGNKSCNLPLVLQVLLEGAHEAALLLGGLEATMAKLGAGVDKLQLDLLQGGTASVSDEGLAEGQDTLLGTNAAALDHDKVIIDHTVVREATHGSNGLLSQVKLGASAVDISARGDAVDLLVHLGAVVETILTGTGNSGHDASRMPSTDTGNLAETLVGLAGKLLGAPTSSDTLETVTLGDTDNVDVLILLKDTADLNLLLKVTVSPVDLVGDGSTVQLHLHQVSLLMGDGSLAGLSVGEDTDD